MTQVETKQTLDDYILEHYGVLGMHWGSTRAQATGKQIRSARRNLSTASNNIMDQKEVISRMNKGSSARAAEKQKLSSMKIANLNNPDRVIANRLTRGEKAATFILATPLTAAAAISITSAASRRIEYKQKTGAYNNKQNAKAAGR